MAGNDDIRGRLWSDEELDLIVADYFDLRALQLAGQAPVKAHRTALLVEQLGRSHKSVEFKHMNISAVLKELGAQPADGYPPMSNYQRAIFPAIDRYLEAHPDALDMMPERFVRPGLPASGVMEALPLLQIDEPPPALGGFEPRQPRFEEQRRLIRKFDPVARDYRNRKLGRAGEELVVEFERRRLHDAGRKDLAGEVRWVADEEGDGHGYDVASFSLAGEQRLIEVKTTNGPQRTPFFLTRNEERVSREQEAFRLYRLYDFAKAPKLFKLRPPLGDSVVLETEVWRAGFG